MSDDGCGDTEKRPTPAPAGVGEHPQSVPAPPTAPQNPSPQTPIGIAVPPASWQPGSADRHRFPRWLATTAAVVFALVLGGVIGGAIGAHAFGRTTAPAYRHGCGIPAARRPGTVAG